MAKRTHSKETPENRNSHHLIVLTNHFPYGLYESFLEHELPVLTKHFEQVVIVCRDISSTGERPVHGATVHRINPQSNWREDLVTIGWCLRYFFRIRADIRTELASLKRENRKLTSYIFDDLVHNVIKALQTARHLRRIIRKEQLEGKVTLYSYWLTSSALATTFVSSPRISISRISRAHGGDVYEYRTPYKYLPFRRTLIHRLDRIFAISENAAVHLRKQAEDIYSDSVQVARLGTKAAGTSPKKTSKRFTIVSCAFMIPVKRIHLLIDALQLIAPLDIHWTHIGGGPLEDDLKKRAKERLGPRNHITYEFLGSLTNEQLMNFYRDNYVDVFVNTSSAEGIPVTIMEAQSFGIPVVAPHVGGIPEVVSEHTGRLFDVDASPLTIAHLISEILSLPSSDVTAMRQQALQNWKTHYNADRNFSTFVAELEKL